MISYFHYYFNWNKEQIINKDKSKLLYEWIRQLFAFLYTEFIKSFIIGILSDISWRLSSDHLKDKYFIFLILLHDWSKLEQIMNNS